MDHKSEETFSTQKCQLLTRNNYINITTFCCLFQGTCCTNVYLYYLVVSKKATKKIAAEMLFISSLHFNRNRKISLCARFSQIQWLGTVTEYIVRSWIAGKCVSKKWEYQGKKCYTWYCEHYTWRQTHKQYYFICMCGGLPCSLCPAEGAREQLSAGQTEEVKSAQGHRAAQGNPTFILGHVGPYHRLLAVWGLV